MNLARAKASAAKSRAGASSPRRGARGGHQEGDGVEEDGRAAVDLLLRGRCGPASRRRPGRDELEHRPLGFSAAERREEAGVDAVGDQHPELAAGEALGPFLMMLSAGEGLRSCGRPGGVGRLAASPSAGGPSATVSASASSMFSRCDDHPLADRRRLDLAQLEGQRVGDVPLLDLGLADEELPGLAVVVGEASPARTRSFGPSSGVGKGCGSPARGDSRGPPLRPRSSARSSTRPFGLRIAMWPSCWKCANGHLRGIDRDVGEVRAAEPLQLGVEVGEVPPLQQRVVGEVDARHDVLGAEGDLLGLGEEVVDACGRGPAGRPAAPARPPRG